MTTAKLKPTDYKTGKEHSWGRKAQAKEETATRRILMSALLPLIAVWIATGSFLFGILAAVGLLAVTMAVGGGIAHAKR